MNIIIRNLETSDYLSTIKIIQSAIRESLGKLYKSRLIEEFCNKYDEQKFTQKAKDINYFVAEDRDSHKILGIIGLKHDELRTFFVDPVYQGQGIGRKLYDKFELEARKNGIRKITLEGSPLGEPIYKHFGFRKIRDIQKERIGITYIDAYMEKDLI